MVRVKICGITNTLDAQRAAQAGAWALGFIFYKKSPRYVSPYKAKKIISVLPPFVTPVGVFVNQKAGAVRDIIDHCGLRAVQLHGDEDRDFCLRFKNFNTKVIKVFRVGQNFDPAVVQGYQADAFLFDTSSEDKFGGSGKTFDWNVLKALKSATAVPLILSGGLNAHNVIEGVNTLKPYAVDVNSGVEESPGRKDAKKVRDFIDIVHYISGPNVKDHV